MQTPYPEPFIAITSFTLSVLILSQKSISTNKNKCNTEHGTSINPSTLTLPHPNLSRATNFAYSLLSFWAKMFLSITITEINLRPARKEISLCVTLTTCIGVLTYLRNTGPLGEAVTICGKTCKQFLSKQNH